VEAVERRRKALDALGVYKERKHGKFRSRPFSSWLMNAQDEHPGKFKYFSCSRKVRYATQSEATRQARKAEKERGVEIRVYFCNFCNGYHLTKQMRRGKRRLKPNNDGE